jgi:hypothetical protein
MTELEDKIVEKVLELVDMEKLTDKIAEKAAELIIQRECPNAPILPPFSPGLPWTTPPSPIIEPIAVMYGVTPTEFKVSDDSQSTAETETYKGKS